MPPFVAFALLTWRRMMIKNYLPFPLFRQDQAVRNRPRIPSPASQSVSI
jgi:hypothetical protein